MSDLSSQLSAFKSRIRSGPSVAVRRAVTPKPANQEVQVPKTPSANGSNGLHSLRDGDRKRVAGESLLSGKKHRSNISMSGSHLSTRLHLAVEYIKQHDKPISVDKLESYLGTDVTEALLPLLKEIDRIKFDATNNTLEYMSLHNIRSADDLLDFLRSQPTFKGTSVKELKDGWSGCMEAIQSLEENDRILVLRNKKENAPRLVWANLGGEIGTLDDEFVEMWNKIKIPEPDNLYQALVDQSLKPTGADPNIIKKKPKREEKKQKKARRGKITNTHMKGILKDYSQLV